MVIPQVRTGRCEDIRLERAAIVDGQKFGLAHHGPRRQGADLVGKLSLVARHHAQAFDGTAGLGIGGQGHPDDAPSTAIDCHHQPPARGALVQSQGFQFFFGKHGEQAALGHDGQKVDLPFVHFHPFERTQDIDAGFDRPHRLHGFLFAVSGDQHAEFVEALDEKAHGFAPRDPQFCLACSFTALIFFPAEDTLHVENHRRNRLALQGQVLVTNNLSQQLHFFSREIAVAIPLVRTLIHQRGLASFL
ncbi:hypothetical protein ACFOHS_03975 [Jhaorihella thermophila]